MQSSSKAVVLDFLARLKPRTLLDAPSGNGWLGAGLAFPAIVDGIDLYAQTPPAGYRSVRQADLDDGLPQWPEPYDCVVSCEGLEHLGNPLGFLRSCRDALVPGGTVIVTTPNIWYPAARLQFFARGFFPGFPCLAGRIQPGSHMHITPWSYPHLYLYLKLAGFEAIELHAEPLSQPGHWWERPFAWPQKVYCRGKARKATDAETKTFWETAGSGPSLHGRHLIMTARRPV